MRIFATVVVAAIVGASCAAPQQPAEPVRAAHAPDEVVVAPAPSPAADPVQAPAAAAAPAADDSREPDRWTGQRDVGEAASEAALATPSRDWRELLRRLDLQIRAGHDEDAVPAMDALRAAEPPLHPGHAAELGATLIHTGRDELAMRLIERFPGVDVPWTDVLLERRARTLGWQAADAWAAARGPADPARWLHRRLRLRERFGAAAELLDEVAAAARARPADTDGFIAWLDAAGAVSPAPDASWVAGAANPSLAFDATRLGESLRNARAPRAAVTVLERSLAMPVTQADADAMTAWFRKRHAAWEGPQTVERCEATLRRSTRFQLADALLAAGEAARAQTVLESLAADAKSTGEFPDLFLAGRIQAASGARVVERKVADAEETEGDTAAYWRRRAEYFRGRREMEKVRDAHARLLAAIDRELASKTWETAKGERYFLVMEKARLLADRDGKRAAYDLLRAEIAAQPATTWEARALVSQIPQDYRDVLDPADPVLWRYLEARPEWWLPEEGLLWRMADPLRGAARDAHWSRAEALATAGPPERARILGWVMTRTDAHARAVPLLNRAMAELTDTSLRGQAAHTLVEACEETGDWRTAEAAWAVVLGIHAQAPSGLTSREIPEWAARPALIAAKAGAADDAMRLWAAKVNLDRGETKGLDEMCRAGMRERLRAFYAGLRARDPKAAPAVERALAEVAK